ncbi:MAG: helix-turn-helix domain-containing protein [Firmicutes bacterium]|nr:helix-turn-helix domain-containing protein [Bacillota bacterium]
MMIADRIKLIRKEAKLTQKQFGERIGVSDAHISKIESNKDNPSDSLIKVICMEFDINEQWLRDGIGNMKDASSRITEKAANNLVSTFEQFSHELKNRFDIDQFKLYGSVLNESLEKLTNKAKTLSNVDIGILVLSLKLFFELLSSYKPDMELQSGFNKYIHEIISNLCTYNMLLDDILLAEHSAEPFDKDNYINSLSEHQKRLLKNFWELFKLHTKNSRRFAELFNDIYSELAEPPISAVKEDEPIYIPVLNMRMLDDIKQSVGRINRHISTDELIPASIKGEAAAGKPIEIFEYDQGTLMIDKKHARYNSFIIRVRGDSMIEADINDGDFAVIRPQPTVENGEIALVNVDGEATIKYFYKTNSGYELRSANSNYAPMFYTAQDNINIIGKVVDVIKPY